MCDLPVTTTQVNMCTICKITTHPLNLVTSCHHLWSQISVEGDKILSAQGYQVLGVLNGSSRLHFLDGSPV